MKYPMKGSLKVWQRLLAMAMCQTLDTQLPSGHMFDTYEKPLELVLDRRGLDVDSRGRLAGLTVENASKFHNYIWPAGEAMPASSAAEVVNDITKVKFRYGVQVFTLAYTAEQLNTGSWEIINGDSVFECCLKNDTLGVSQNLWSLMSAQCDVSAVVADNEWFEYLDSCDCRFGTLRMPRATDPTKVWPLCSAVVELERGQRELTFR